MHVGVTWRTFLLGLLAFRRGFGLQLGGHPCFLDFPWHMYWFHFCLLHGVPSVLPSHTKRQWIPNCWKIGNRGPLSLLVSFYRISCWWSSQHCPWRWSWMSRTICWPGWNYPSWRRFERKFWNESASVTVMCPTGRFVTLTCSGTCGRWCGFLWITVDTGPPGVL